MSARAATTLAEQEAQLRTFKEIATLQRIAVGRPADAATDYAGGAKAARAHGMPRLAKRLEELAASASTGGATD
jgi:hypothetical protein